MTPTETFGSASTTSTVSVCLLSLFVALYSTDAIERFPEFAASGTVTRPTGTPPTFPPPTDCYNGGQLVNGNTPDATCYCLPFFTGRQCERKLCFNDGYLASDNECICLTGFTGTYCQDGEF